MNIHLHHSSNLSQNLRKHRKKFSHSTMPNEFKGTGFRKCRMENYLLTSEEQTADWLEFFFVIFENMIPAY